MFSKTAQILLLFISLCLGVSPALANGRSAGNGAISLARSR
jgi:hypothetical protein